MIILQRHMIFHEIFIENMKISTFWQRDSKIEKMVLQGEQKWAQRVPKVSQGAPKVSQREPKGGQRWANGTQKGGNGNRKGAKREPRRDQNASKSRPSEKVAKREPKGGARGIKFGSHLRAFSIKNRWKNRSENLCRTSHESLWKKRYKHVCFF